MIRKLASILCLGLLATTARAAGTADRRCGYEYGGEGQPIRGRGRCGPSRRVALKVRDRLVGVESSPDCRPQQQERRDGKKYGNPSVASSY